MTVAGAAEVVFRSPRMSTPVRIGVVGLRRGMSIAGVIRAHPRCVVSAVCDVNPKRLAEAASELEAEPHDDFRAMVDSDIDAVVVATPPVSHAQFSILALESGKHVLS